MSLLVLASTALASPIAAPATIAGPDSGPATPDPAAIYYNPGAIGATKGVDVLVDIQLSKIDIEATTTRNGGIDPNTEEAYNVATAHVLVPVAFLGVTWAPNEYVAGGFGITDSFIGGGDYTSSETDAPPYTSHQRYAGIQTRIITLSLMPAVAVTPIEGVHVGGGFSYVYDKVDLLKASDPLGGEGKGIDGAYTADVILSADASGGHTTWNAGIFVDKFKLAQVGLSYSSRGALHTEGTATVDAPAFIVDPELMEEGETTYRVNGKMTFDMPLPSILRAAVASQINDKLRVGVVYELYMWNDCCGAPSGDAHIVLTNDEGNPVGPENGLALEVNPDIYAPRRLYSVTTLAGNGGYWITPWLWSGARVGYKQYAVPDYAVSATNLDFESIGATLAARVKVSKSLTVGAVYTKNFLKTRTITNSAWDVRDPDDANYVDDRFSAKNPYGANANGVYSGESNVFGVRIGVDL